MGEEGCKLIPYSFIQEQLSLKEFMENLNNWRYWYWLAGGLILLVATPIVIFSSRVLNPDLAYNLVSFAHYPVFILERITGLNLGDSVFALYYVQPAIVMFIVGAFLGRVYGKFKNRKQLST